MLMSLGGTNMAMTQIVLAVLHVPHLVRPMADLNALVPLYVGPDQMLPVMSALGAVVGVLLMVWHRVVAIVRKTFRLMFRRSAPAAVPEAQMAKPPEEQA